MALTANSIPKATNADHIGDSSVVDDGTTVTTTKPVVAPSLTVVATTVAGLAALPAVLGTQASVSDGDPALAWGATVVNTGAGTTKYLVWYNGAAWKVVGK